MQRLERAAYGPFPICVPALSCIQPDPQVADTSREAISLRSRGQTGNLQPEKMMSVPYEAVLAAARRIQPVIQETSYSHSHSLSSLTGRSIYIKWENQHPCGSFKERGASNFLARLHEADPSQPVFAASAGNHALAVSWHAARLKHPCTIVMPRYAPLVKVQRTRSHGATVALHGSNFDEARSYAQETYGTGATGVPAFDHEDIIAGQGTCGLELARQAEDLDAVLVPVGGGGLISGIAVALKAIAPSIAILGVQSEWAVEGRKQAHTGLLSTTSLADGIAVKRVGQITQRIIDSLVDDMLVVSEQEIAHSVIRLLRDEHVLAEGAGAAGFAALLHGHVPDRFRRIAIIQTGSNMDLNVLSRLIEWDMAHQERLLKIRVSVPDRPGTLQRVSEIVAAAHANVLRVLHDRSFAEQPGCVQIGFVLEVEDPAHGKRVIEQLQSAGLSPQTF